MEYGYGSHVQRKPTKTGIISEQTFKQFSEFCYPQQERQLNPHAPPWKSTLQQDSTDETCANPTLNGEDYLETMKKLTVAAHLPKSEISMFDGNPLKIFSYDLFRIMLRITLEILANGCSFCFYRKSKKSNRRMYSSRSSGWIL